VQLERAHSQESIEEQAVQKLGFHGSSQVLRRQGSGAQAPPESVRMLSISRSVR
jgi:hypothetical protein